MSDAIKFSPRESEEADSDTEGETDVSSEDDISFERIVALEDTPWAEFVSCAGTLMTLLAAFLLVQALWTVLLKSYIDIAYLPVSIILVPVAFWWLRRSKCVSFQRVQGIDLICYFLLRHTRCRQSEYTDAFFTTAMNKAQTLGDQVEEASAFDEPNGPASRKRGHTGYNLGLLTCIIIFWTLLVGQSCWPIGYMYLTHYSFARCQYVCEEVKLSIPRTNIADTLDTGDALLLTIDSKSPVARAHLIGNCSQRLGFAYHQAFPSEVLRRVLDPHWRIHPEGAWVPGQPLQGLTVYYNASEKYGVFDETDCSRIYPNTAIITVTLLLVLAAAAVFLISHRSVVLSSSAVLLALLCTTGIGKVWMGAITCQRSSLHSHALVFSHLLHSCISVVTYSSATSFASSMLSSGHKMAAYESNFRHSHRVARSESHFGSVAEVFPLVLVIAAHTAFRYKRMQTREARFHILCRRPKLVRCMLEHLEFLDSMPTLDRFSMAGTLYKVYKLHEGKIPDLEPRVRKMMAMRPSQEDLDAASSSFWPAMVYSFVRALIPSVYRHFSPLHAVVPALPDSDTLWMLNAASVMLTNILVYLFVLFQVQEATRRYVRCMQQWLLFESAWNFPSQATLRGDALIEIVQVEVQEDEEVVEMLDRSRDLIGDFSCECDSEDGGKVVDLQAVRERLPIWWAWREYLIIDYTDKKVRLELNLVVVFAMLLMSAAQICLDYFSRRVELPNLMDPAGASKWFGAHTTALTFQTAWDALFLMVPVLHAINCAVTMNRMIESQLQKVIHLEEVVGSDLGGEPGSELQVRSIFSMARSELERGGAVTMLLSVCKINKQMLAIVGTVLSLFGGGQAVEIYQSFGV